MKIELKNIKVRDVVDGYRDNGESGVVGYGGKLNIRPAYQREFIYGNKERDAVIKTIRQGFPLNTMYWAKTNEGEFELMDGQQRTISICQYITDIIPIKFNEGHELAFDNLTIDQKQQILDYELSVYECEGTDSEKLDWFKTINIAGMKLTDQELRNAIYTGPWLAKAKLWFSKTNCPAYRLGEKYVNGSPIRQEYLEKALDWISGGKIEYYMSKHQQDNDAQELWQYFHEVVSWIERVFPNYRKFMKGLEWGRLYNEHKNDKLNAANMEKRIVELIYDDEVDSKKGIYEYLLRGNEKTLNLRTFDGKTKVKQYEKQKGICPICKKHFEIEEMEADHIKPWHDGGKTTVENCQMLCKQDNRTKSGK
ncbi:MAG: DUF262 domain-containing protein [Deltaproteobacteria bacterium]|nr:DUF262 domain-containing protein [Deltaproteobacteria bacterium]MCL5892880.1 DUF262 domain-containing protein [Deltaproteobacteria bacterium]